MVNITYRGKTPEFYGAWLANKPVITHSTLKRNSYDIPSRDGLLYGSNIYRSDATIEILLHMNNDNWLQSMREVRKWISGFGTLTFSDTPDSYYEVVNTSMTEEQRLTDDYGRLRVIMTIVPYEFLSGGTGRIENPSEIVNSYDKSKPIYEISGTAGDTGTLTIYRPNGSVGGVLTFKMPSTGKIKLDTRKLIATDVGEIREEAIDGLLSGDYTKFHLESGRNRFAISSGFTFNVIPRWGYYV